MCFSIKLRKNEILQKGMMYETNGGIVRAIFCCIYFARTNSIVNGNQFFAKLNVSQKILNINLLFVFTDLYTFLSDFLLRKSRRYFIPSIAHWFVPFNRFYIFVYCIMILFSFVIICISLHCVQCVLQQRIKEIYSTHA